MFLFQRLLQTKQQMTPATLYTYRKSTALSISFYLHVFFFFLSFVSFVCFFLFFVVFVLFFSTDLYLLEKKNVCIRFCFCFFVFSSSSSFNLYIYIFLIWNGELYRSGRSWVLYKICYFNVEYVSNTPVEYTPQIFNNLFLSLVFENNSDFQQ